MKVFDFSNYSNIFTIGDIHGEFNALIKMIKRGFGEYEKTRHSDSEFMPSLEIDEHGRYYINHVLKPIQEPKDKEKEDDAEKPLVFRKGIYSDSIFVVVGDIGLGFKPYQYYIDTLTSFNEECKENNTHVLFMRGNHDDPSYFSEEKINLSNIKSIPDYSVLKFQDHNALCIGGGTSIDALWRKQREVIINAFNKPNKFYKKLYWDEEATVFSKEDIEQINESGIKIDLLFTHVPPTSKNVHGNQDILNYWLSSDQSLEETLYNEKQTMHLIYQTLEKLNHIKLWVSGHMHYSNMFTEKKTLCVQLNVEEMNSIEQMFEIQERKKKKTKKSDFKLFSWDDMVGHKQEIKKLKTDDLDEFLDRLDESHVQIKATPQQYDEVNLPPINEVMMAERNRYPHPNEIGKTEEIDEDNELFNI